uniref:Uncharacterized protein n=1 Tax=Anguilla anguilla TaxID=7936 RepID=A0A0E9QYN4_ANGAN
MSMRDGNVIAPFTNINTLDISVVRSQL